MRGVACSLGLVCLAVVETAGCASSNDSGSPLLQRGTLDAKSFAALSTGLEQAAVAAHTLSELFEAYRRAVADVAQASLERALQYVREHYTEPIDVAVVAKIAGFAPNYFSKLFKAREQTTFVRHLTLLRVERAKQLLRATDLPATWVAEQCGFRSSEYFSRVFRRAAARTPLEFRAAPGPAIAQPNTRRRERKVHRVSVKSP